MPTTPTNNITYFLGAGASVGCLPIYVKSPNKNSPQDFERRLRDFSSAMTFLDNKELSQNTEKFAKELAFHRSIDTVAKKYWLIQDTAQLRLLKSIVSAFFIYEQISKIPDMRYDSFIATILNKHRHFPNNMKVISWNYDIQFELAVKNYFPNINHSQPNYGTMYHIQNLLNTIPYVQENNMQRSFDYDRFGIIRLNGTAGLRLGIGAMNDFGVDIYKTYNESQLKLRIEEWYLNTKTSDALMNTFSYSWEGTKTSYQAQEFAIKTIGITDVLVIIGYSFPLFNREVDDLILKQIPTETKIIVQSPDANIIKDTLMRRYSFASERIETITYTEQFWLPD